VGDYRGEGAVLDCEACEVPELRQALYHVVKDRWQLSPVERKFTKVREIRDLPCHP
jgi:hypothetical protein